MSKAGKTWLFAKYDGARKVWEREIPYYRFTRIQAGELLQRLAATDLTSEEVMDSADPGTGTSLLGIHQDGLTMSCGENPHYTATLTIPE